MKRWTVSLPSPDGYDIQPFDTTFHIPQKIVLAADHDAEIERLRERNGYLNKQRDDLLTGLDQKDAEIERLRHELADAHGVAQACEMRAEKADEIGRLRDILLRAGFVQCDIPACNCGSWHHRYGLPERWEEIKQIVEEAGHPLTNANGHILRKAVQELISAKDAEIERLRGLLLEGCDPHCAPGWVERVREAIGERDAT